MDLPVNLSQSFVNKQNVRSFGNMVSANTMKARTTEFLLNIFVTVGLVSELSPFLISLISDMRTNLKQRCKDDFKMYFSALKSSEKPPLTPIGKELVMSGCWTALCDILPKQLIGGNHNLKLFKKLTNFVVFSMKGEHVLMPSLVDKWDFTVSPWSTYPVITAKNILCHLLLWISKNVISPIISLNFYVASTKLSPDDYKLYFFWKNEWQSYYDKKISTMVSTKVLLKEHGLSKNNRKRCSPQKRLKLKKSKKDVPKLCLILKGNNDYRPIVRYKNSQRTSAEKKKIKQRFDFLRLLTGNMPIKIESEYTNLYRNWISLGKPQLYFVKADLSNAFGSINREKLFKILCDHHIQFQKTEKDLALKKKIAVMYKELVSELRTPLLVRAGSTMYQWTRGLVQGYTYSPALSEMYYSTLDAVYFSFLKKSESKLKFFTRIVDDYLFITDSLQEAHGFLEALSSYHNVNYAKTVVNFNHPHIEKKTEISFLGYSYNTMNLQVSRASTIFTGQMCFKIAFSSAVVTLHKFLENRIGQSGIPVNGHIFNLHYNSEELIWRHIFTTLCLSANKFCTILAILSNEGEMASYLAVYKKRVTVKLCNSMIETLNKNKPEDALFVYCINHFRFLSWKSLHLCAKKTPKCSSLLVGISDEMAKCNCVLGKWREHWSRIGPDGVGRRPAVREVCRRTDLRMLYKTFDELPSGFQCYTAKSRY